ncbi:MAG: glycosyltransferase family 4 protein [Chloroflexi bacterium]|nr:glycosyltransferase family 4 protein [Chloroflexota bacterium]
MRIALYNLTTTTKRGGVETFVWGLARELASRGVEVDIIGGIGKVTQEAGTCGVIRHAFVDRNLFRAIPGLRTAWAVTKLMERLTLGVTSLPGIVGRGYDIIHIQKPYDLPAGVAARTLSGVKLLFGCHGKDFFPGDRLFIPFIDGAVSCSRFNAAQVKERYGVQPRVVYNGIDSEFFRPLPPDPVFRRRFAPAEEKVLLFAGRLVRWKGVQYLIEAMPEVMRQIPARLVIAADGPYKEDLVALANGLGIAPAVAFIGQVPHDQMPRYFSMADLVVGSSFANETFGIALCEAMACEKPVVASDFGGFSEVVEEGITGLLVPPQDSGAFASKIVEVLSDERRAVAMGKAGRRVVIERYSWQAVGDNVMKEYQRLLSQ